LLAADLTVIEWPPATEECLMRNADIIGWGKALPPTVLSNHDLEKIVDTSDEWISTRTGIKERRISHVEGVELARVASERAIAAAGIEPGEIDLVLHASCTPTSLLPSSASFVQDQIGATNAGALDTNAACSGWLYTYVVAASMIQSGAIDCALVVGVEKLSYILDFTDRTTCVLFGDGAGATILRATDEPVGLLASELGNDGSTIALLQTPIDGSHGGPGPRDPSTSAVEMQGPEVFRRAVTMMGDASAAVVERAGWGVDDVDLLIPHQANQRIIDATARRLKLDESKVFVNVHAYGNTSAATIPIALTEAIEQGRMTPGANVVFAAFGGGLSWGAAAVRWGDRVEPVAESDAELPPTDASVMELLQPSFDFFGPDELRSPEARARR
jgi:3-oxoacyl-[acyl-carrier-protein] synthase-3